MAVAFDKLTRRDPAPDWLERREATRSAVEALAKAKASASGVSFAKAYAAILAEEPELARAVM